MAKGPARKATRPKRIRSPIRRRIPVTTPKKILGVMVSTRNALKGFHGKPGVEDLRRGLDLSALRGLFSKTAYPAQMHPKTKSQLIAFLRRWRNKNATLNVHLTKQALAAAKAKGTKAHKEFDALLEKNRELLERRLYEKAALEQVLFVLSNRRSARAKPMNPVRATKEVRKWASNFYDPKDLTRSFIRLVEAVSRIPIHNAPRQIAEAYYGLPTAEETIKADGILAMHTRSGNPSWGCGMQCNVINAALNAWGWGNFHMRTVTNRGNAHSVVLTKVPIKGRNLWLVADPFMNGQTFIGLGEKFKGSPVVSQLGRVLSERIAELEKQRKWKKGKSLASHIKNYVEFNREA